MQSNSLLIRLYIALKKDTALFIYAPLIIYWISLFIFTTIPADKIPQFFIAQDKAEHLFAYFFLSILLNLSLHFQKRYTILSKYSFFTSAFFLIFYATLDEVHQIFIPGRFCDLYDWIADILGGLFGIFLVFIFIRKYFRYTAM